MNALKTLSYLGLALAVSACSTTSPVTRSKAVVPTPQVLNVAPVAQVNPEVQSEPQIRVEAVRVYVNPELQVSERNTYYPGVDIVWRGDPPGNRHQQVRDIFELAFARGTDGLDGRQPVELHVNVLRFHALTDKARYTIGGVHAITFVLQLRDAETGAALGAPKKIRADLKAYGGQAAVNADARGDTQKKRITEHLASVIRAELSAPEGYSNKNLGLLQGLNQL